jgi:hypothetical protein
MWLDYLLAIQKARWRLEDRHDEYTQFLDLVLRSFISSNCGRVPDWARFSFTEGKQEKSRKSCSSAIVVTAVV